MGGVEIELKAALQPAELAKVARLVARRASAARTDLLITRYLDTPDGRLAAAGIALRLRTSPGKPVVQSIKAGRVALGGFQHAREWEAELPGPGPDLSAVADTALVARLHALIDGHRLVRQFETRVRRRSFRLVEPGGEVDIAIDRGLIRAGKARETISEIELELKAGSPEILFILARGLLAHRPARLLLPNKAERGAALAAGAPLGPAVVSSRPVEVPQATPSGEGFDRLMLGLSEAVAANLYMTLVSEEPEGPHQLRVALRRLRTALRLFRPILERDLADELARTARDIGRLVSPLRDADVLAGGLLMPRADPGLASVLRRWTEETRRTVRGQLLDVGATGFAIRLLSLAALGGWQRQGQRDRLLRPHEEVVRPALSRLWARVSHAGKRLAGLSPEERHELRKDLKKLRYAMEMVSREAQPGGFVPALKRLLQDLGDLNDLSVLEGFQPDLGSAEANAALAALKSSLPHASTARTDQLLGRACRHWRALAPFNPLVAAASKPGAVDPSGPRPSVLEEPSR
ncbi:CYTH and CHAD domain-containing protein [Thermaurantiacus sp.]